MKSRFRLLLFSLLIVLLAIPTFIVLAKEISSVAVSGPGIQGVITLDAHDEVYELMDAGLIDTNGFMAAPDEKLGTPYTLTVSLDLDGKILPFIQMDYYPKQAGQAGYLHYTGRMDGESLHPADDWGMMPLKADGVFRRLMSARGIELESAFSAPAAAAPAAAAPRPFSMPIQPLYLALAAVVVILLAGAGVLLRRRALSR
jgi:hypothetical protein